MDIASTEHAIARSDSPARLVPRRPALQTATTKGIALVERVFATPSTPVVTVQWLSAPTRALVPELASTSLASVMLGGLVKIVLSARARTTAPRRESATTQLATVSWATLAQIALCQPARTSATATESVLTGPACAITASWALTAR